MASSPAAAAMTTVTWPWTWRVYPEVEGFLTGLRDSQATRVWSGSIRVAEEMPRAQGAVGRSERSAEPGESVGQEKLRPPQCGGK